MSILLLAIGMFLLLILSVWRPSAVIRELQAEPLSSEDMPEVLASICRLSEMARVPSASAYRTRADHFASSSVGWSPTSSVIVLNIQALEVLTAEERDSVIASEIAHIKFRDHLWRHILILTFGLGYLLSGGMLLQIVQVYRDIGQDIRNGVNPHVLSDQRLFYLLGTPLVPGLLLLTLVFGIPIKAIIAEQEYRADAWSAQAMGSALPLARAISKIGASAAASNKRIHNYSVFSVAEPRSPSSIQMHLYSFLYPQYLARIDRLSKCLKVKH